MATREDRPGIGVDAKGGGVIDPTKNVLDLVLAAVTRLNDLMAAFNKRQDDLSNLETKRQDELRDALDLRLTALGTQGASYEQRIQVVSRDYEKQIEDIKSDFGKQIATILQAQADKSALLLSNQVDKLGTSTADRLALVEKNQYVSGGTASIRDPATDRALADIAATLRQLTEGTRVGEGKGLGQSQLITLIFAGIAAAAVLYNVFGPHVASVIAPH
jgi:hypothetical protein